MVEPLLWQGRLYRQARARLPAALVVCGLLPQPSLWPASRQLGFALDDGRHTADCLLHAGAWLASRGRGQDGRPLLQYRLWQAGAGCWQALSEQGWALQILPGQRQLWLSRTAACRQRGPSARP